MRITKTRTALLATASLQIFGAGQAFAQAATDNGTVIVTARRVEERLQDVPISIAVVDQDRLTRSNVTSAEDLVRVVPGLNVQSRFSPEQSSFSIRGFGQLQRTSSSVGTYFGEVVAPRGGAASVSGGDGAGPGSLFDLQNVQVLKGPQGTLFGRNTTGGAVILAPRKPTDEFEGYVEGSLGNFNMRRLQGVVNIPLAPWARLRLGGDYQKSDGYLNNTSGIGPNKFADTDYYALRGSLVLDVRPNIENYTILSYFNSNNNGSPGQIFRANPVNVGFASQARDQIARYAASGDPYQIEQDLINPHAQTEQFQIINTTTYDLSDTIRLKNIVSYSHFIQDVRQQAYSTNFLFSPTAYIATGSIFHPEGVHTNDQENFTEELQLQGNLPDGSLTYQAGLYFEDSTPGSRVASTAPSVGSICLISGFTTLANSTCRAGARATPQYGSVKFINMAAYAQATYALTEHLKATAGIRYTYDRSIGESNGYTLGYTSPTPGTFVNPTTSTCTVGFTLPDCSFRAKTSDKVPTWTLNLAYSPNDDAMIYATYSRGYRQGAVTPFAVSGFPVFGPEEVDSYELGAKLTLDGPVSGSLNLAGFYSDLKNNQLQIGLQNSVNGQNASSIFNAGKARIYGVELDSTLKFSRSFRLNGSAAYVNSKLQQIDLPTSFPGYNIVLPSAVVGDPLPFTPEWGANISGTYTVPVDENLGTIELSAAYRYNSTFYTNASTVSSIGSTPVHQWDLNADWRNVGGSPIDISLYGVNVTDQFTQGVVVALYNQLGYDARYVGQPRTYGVRVRYRFGG